ncbi:MAG: peptidase P60 [Rhizobiaceae bacterium]|nr:peptidase P60 [Rhizobiaceae bacterium]
MNNSSNAARIVRAARDWLGTPYQHQASLKHVGCDCLGLVRGVWREIEGSEPEPVPPYSSAWSAIGGRERLIEAGESHFQPVPSEGAQAGDFIVFRLRRNAPAKHAGILATSSSFIHAYDGASVVESALSGFWRDRIAGVFRFPSVGDRQRGT